jgi:hypothetical protein
MVEPYVLVNKEMRGSSGPSSQAAIAEAGRFFRPPRWKQYVAVPRKKRQKEMTSYPMEGRYMMRTIATIRSTDFHVRGTLLLLRDLS